MVPLMTRNLLTAELEDENALPSVRDLATRVVPPVALVETVIAQDVQGVQQSATTGNA